MRPYELQIIGGPKSLNTTRTEVAPGSHVVRKNFQCDWRCHINTLEDVLVFLHWQDSAATYYFTATLLQPTRQGCIELRCRLLFQV